VLGEARAESMSAVFDHTLPISLARPAVRGWLIFYVGEQEFTTLPGGRVATQVATSRPLGSHEHRAYGRIRSILS